MKKDLEAAKNALHDMKPFIAQRPRLNLLPVVDRLERLLSTIVGLTPALASLAPKLQDQGALISSVNEEYDLSQEYDEVSEADEASLADDSDTDSYDSDCSLPSMRGR